MNDQPNPEGRFFTKPQNDNEVGSGLDSQFSFLSKAKDVRIVAVGVGQYEDFQGQLEEIAGENVHNASNFDQLSNLFSDILAETCSKYSELRFLKFE